MNKTAKAEVVLATLDRLYPAPPIPLRHQDPVTLLGAVVLSAQCTDLRVNQVTPALFAKAHTPQQMAELAVEEIQAFIRPCGLAPQKARAIRTLSELITHRHGGEVPRTLAELEDLPGVGHKTAQVVVSQAFGEPAFPVDTHIHRLAWRWGLSEGKNVLQTERDLKKLFPRERWNRLHLQMIYFGREHCQARGHDPRACPLCAQVGRRELFSS